MAHPVILPRQGQSVETCIITEWKKKEGDRVQPGDVLFSYETDKASFEEQAKEAGQLLKVFFQEDDEVPVLTTVALIGEPGEDVSAYAPEGAPEVAEQPAERPAEAAKPETAPAAAAPAPAAQAAREGFFAASPRARATAQRLGLDVHQASPTGPQGRVIERDVFAIERRLVPEAPAPRRPRRRQRSIPTSSCPTCAR